MISIFFTLQCNSSNKECLDFFGIWQYDWRENMDKRMKCWKVIWTWSLSWWRNTSRAHPHKVTFSGWVLHHINIWQHSSFTGEENLRCPSMQYFRHISGHPELNYRLFVNWQYNFLKWKNPKSMVGFKPTIVKGKWFEVNNLNHLATDTPSS